MLLNTLRDALMNWDLAMCNIYKAHQKSIPLQHHTDKSQMVQANFRIFYASVEL